MPSEFRDIAKPIADEIMHKVMSYLRYEMEIYPKAHDVSEMNRLVKSIIVQTMLRKGYDKREDGV
jgi:predicted transcriptional regulator with HTH domain